MPETNIISFYEQHLTEVRPSTNGWFIARCPFHNDRNPSFAFHGRSGNWKCLADCGHGSLKDFCERMDIDLPTIETVYPYYDELGELVYEAVRRYPRRFIMRRSNGRGGYINNIQGVQLYLYNLRAVLENDTVFICEGEKDCDTLTALDLAATTNPMGSGKWQEGFNQCFTGKEVIILPDNDLPGLKHAENVAKNLYPVAQSVKIVLLPNLPDKGDVTDWLEQGHSKEELLSIVAETGLWNPANAVFQGSQMALIPLSVLLQEADE